MVWLQIINSKPLLDDRCPAAHTNTQTTDVTSMLTTILIKARSTNVLKSESVHRLLFSLKVSQTKLNKISTPEEG